MQKFFRFNNSAVIRFSLLLLLIFSETIKVASEKEDNELNQFEINSIQTSTVPNTWDRHNINNVKWMLKKNQTFYLFC